MRGAQYTLLSLLDSQRLIDAMMKARDKPNLFTRKH